jgi:hypothetical protein
MKAHPGGGGSGFSDGQDPLQLAHSRRKEHGLGCNHGAVDAAQSDPDLPVSLAALHDKVNRTEPQVVRALVQGSAERLLPVVQPMKKRAPWAAGYQVRVLDGNHLPASEKRLEPLRDYRGAALPGQSLAEEFARNVAAQTDAIMRGDRKGGNKDAKRYIAAYKKLRDHGEAGRDVLSGLLTHSRMDVRVYAAGCLLSDRPERALPVLRY